MHPKLKMLLFVVCFLGFFSIRTAGEPTGSIKAAPEYVNSWAVIVAGSEGFDNYRHQANSHHVYQILRRNGMSKDHIITMFVNDIAWNKANPFPGRIYNRATFSSQDEAVNVYKDVQKDYTGKDVSAVNFLNIITGNSTTMSGIGSGRVLNSTKDDHVFIYLSDHGQFSMFCFPHDYLYSTNLSDAFTVMWKAKMYKKLVVFVEMCESGSLVEDLPKNMSIYAVTASAADQDHYAALCPNTDDVVMGKHLQVCLTGEFTMAFTNILESAGPFQTLKDQFIYTRNHVTHSIPQQYGDLTIDAQISGAFLGEIHKFDRYDRYDPFPSVSERTERTEGTEITHINERDANFVSKFYNVLNFPSPQNYDALKKEIDKREKIDRSAFMIYNSLVESVEGVESVKSVENIENVHLQCYFHTFIRFYERCGDKNEYSSKYTDTFRNLCMSNLSVNLIHSIIETIC